ncbi:hypothetical protein OBBRIDRAFT_173977 [Obba rivulosa]|uniref:DUF6534 domain-containing protein n=1 Tax=Obba rivulosa TaxID=1052685 RepID=A0A8E2ARU8_9APHY|nr:hypothetical protein OBBRIDRAFT_173977 [Obba rivulosa]
MNATQVVSSAISAAPHSLIDDTLGVGLVGVIISAVLYGTTIGQCRTYFDHATADSHPVKFLVGLLCLLNTMHIVFVTHVLYHYTITFFGNPQSETEPPIWSVSVLIPVEILLETIVRGLFCYRVWKLSGKYRIRLFVIPIMLCSTVTFAGGLDFMRKEIALATFVNLHTVAGVLYISTGAGAAADVMIAILQVILLWRCRTGFTRTDNVLRALMLYSINTGAITSLCAAICIIMFAVKPTSYIYIAFYLVLPQLLLISLLATYNARRDLREAATAEKVPMELLETVYAFRDTTKITRIGPDTGFGKLSNRVSICPMDTYV